MDAKKKEAIKKEAKEWGKLLSKEAGGWGKAAVHVGGVLIGLKGKSSRKK